MTAVLAEFSHAPRDGDDKLSWLRLIRSEGIGPTRLYKYLRHYGAAQAAVDDLAHKGKLISEEAIQQEIDAHHEIGAQLIFVGDPDYPLLLQRIADPPPVLSVLGKTTILNSPYCLAIVGARNASLNGRSMAYSLAKDLGKHNITVVSGLARGIDAQAHRGCLDTGTIAVLAGGVDQVYPAENAELYAQVIEHGAIISEMPLGTHIQASLFPRRNRIISGLSRGVIVVEAAEFSGSLITARCALEQGREVFAVPGSPLDPRCRGTNRLIREGATLIQGTDDILTEILPLPIMKAAGIDDTFIPTESAAPKAPLHNKILEILSTTPIGVDELARQCQVSLNQILSVLAELEMEEQIHRYPGNLVARTFEG